MAPSLLATARRPAGLVTAVPANATAAPRAIAPRPHGTAACRSLVSRCAASKDDKPHQQQPQAPQEPRPTPPNGSNGGSTVAALSSEDGPSSSSRQANLFLEPLARNFILGIGAGITCEAVHVASKFFSAGCGGAGDLLMSHADQLKPLFVTDHAVAIGAWVLLYAIEACAISGVLRRFNNDTDAAAATVRSMPTLPKRLFPMRLNRIPMRLNRIKAALYRAIRCSPRLSASARPAAEGAVTPFSTADDDITGGVFSLDGDGASDMMAAASGTAVDKLERMLSGGSRRSSGLGRSLERALSDIEASVRAPERKLPGGPLREDDDDDDDGAVGPTRRSSRRDRELQERCSYLKNFWYAAALSSNLKPGQPLGVDVLDTRVVLFRDEETGKVTCLDDACPHRGAPLSAGWLSKAPDSGSSSDGCSSSSGGRGGGGGGGEGAGPKGKRAGSTCVVCPYHGWAFDGEGRLRDVPSAEKGTWPKRPIVGSYAVEEKGGFVWLFFGDARMPADERPPIPFTPELEDPSWRAVYGEIEFDCGHWGVFENAIDMAHIHYLHSDSFGNQEKPRVMDMTTTRDTFSCMAAFKIHNKPVSPLWEWTSVPVVPVEARAMLPSTSAVKITLAYGVSMITFVNTVPISADRAINRFCLIRNFATSPVLDWMARNNMYKILGEDKVMVDRLRAEALPQEYSLAPDAPQLVFRQLRNEWVRMGYAVPPASPDRPRRGLLPADE